MGEVEDKPPMFVGPLHDVGMLVGGIVVDDDMVFSWALWPR